MPPKIYKVILTIVLTLTTGKRERVRMSVEKPGFETAEDARDFAELLIGCNAVAAYRVCYKWVGDTSTHPWFGSEYVKYMSDDIAKLRVIGEDYDQENQMRASGELPGTR